MGLLLQTHGPSGSKCQLCTHARGGGGGTHISAAMITAQYKLTEGNTHRLHDFFRLNLYVCVCVCGGEGMYSLS